MFMLRLISFYENFDVVMLRCVVTIVNSDHLLVSYMVVKLKFK